MLVFCTVNFKDYKSTTSYIESYLSLCLSNSFLIIVDNEYDIQEHTKLKKMFSKFNQLIFLSSTENLGYFGAAFMALDYFKKEIGFFDFFCITNNDITFDRNTDWTGVLREYTNSNVACIAPKIISTRNGFNQNPFHIFRPSIFHYLKFYFLFKSYFITSIFYNLRKYFSKKNHHTTNNLIKPTPIYAAQGAFFILSREFFDSGYDIEGLPFLYSEEISVAEHCLRNSLRIFYEPRLCVFHNEHQATGASMSFSKYNELKKSIQYILRNFYK